MGEAELILAVFDGSQALTEEARELARQIAKTGVTSVAVCNKCDLGVNALDEETAACFTETVTLSAKDGMGMEELRQTVERLFCDGALDLRNDAIVSDARQQAALVRSRETLSEALEELRVGLPLDLCCVGIECAMSALGEVDGREIGEEIVSEIFSRFCVGK